MTKEQFNPTVSFFVDRNKPTWLKKMIDKETGKVYYKEVAAYPTTYESAIANKAKHKKPDSPSILEHWSLFDALELIPKINHPVKGAEGSIFFFKDDTTVYHTVKDREARGTDSSIGICGVDLDEMPEELAHNINVSFWKYVAEMPQLITSYISHSGKGIHLIIRCRVGLSSKEYVKEDIVQTARFIETVKKVDGIDLTQYIDPSSTSMSQRHFLSHCDNVPINKEAEYVEIPIPTECPITSGTGDTEILENVLLAIKKRWNSSDRKELASDEIAEQMMKELLPEQFREEFEYELEEITTPEEIYVKYNSRWVVWCTLYKLLKGDKRKFDREVKKIADVFERNNPHGDTSDKYYAEAWKSIENIDRVTSAPMGTMYRLGYITKNAQIAKKEREILAEKSKSEDKRKKIVELRKKFISHIVPSASKIKLKGRYISDTEIPIIEKTVRENERVTLKAPTGTGKTTAIKRIANEHDAVVLAPFNVLVQEYATDLKVIKDEKEYNGKACCMTYDRLVIMGTHNFRNKWIFIDEAHVLFMHRTYRPKLVELFKQLDRLTANGCKIIFVSATPIFTEGTKLLEFYQDRPFVRVIPVFLQCKDGKHGKRAENFIKNRILDDKGLDEPYDRILIFTDNSARRLYDSTVFVKGDKVGIMHSNYPEECEKITLDNKLKAKYTMCTSIAYNGVNFTNKDEYIAVVSMVEDETTAWNIIQQCGRVRNSIVDLFILFDTDSVSERLTVEQRVKLNELRGELGLNNKILWDDQIEADKEVEQYIKENSDRFKILNELINEEYFWVRGQIYLKLDGEPKHNPVRKAVDDYIKRNLCAELLDSTIIPNFDKEIMTKYFRESINAINSLLEGQYNTNVNEIAELLKNTGTKSIKTVVAELKHIKTALSFSDSDLIFMEARYKNMLEEYKNDKILLKQLRTQVNEIEKMHSEYINCKNDHEIITAYNAAQIAKRDNQSNGRSKGGKKFGIEIKVTKNGKTKTFKSKKDAAEWIGCSRPTLDAAIKSQKSLNGFTIS